MGIKEVVTKVFPDLWDFGVTVVNNHLQNRPRKQDEVVEEEEKPLELLTDEELDAMAKEEFSGFIGELEEGETVEGSVGFEGHIEGIEVIEIPEVKEEKTPWAVPEEGDIKKGKSFEGQSAVDYCIECAVKHSQTAKVLMREALQRANAGDPALPGVMEKVRGVTEELCGLEDDTSTVDNKRVVSLNTMARELRKTIYTSGAELGTAKTEDLEKIKKMTDVLVEATYLVRGAEECPNCDLDGLIITPK